MSNIFDRSKGSLKQYFSQPEEFEKQFAKYSLKNKTLRPSKRYGCAGNGGVPLSWNTSAPADLSDIAVDDSDTHTLVIGATASKKSRLVAMPMVKILESAKESMIIVDPKSEIFERTSESLRKSGYNVLSVDLRNPQIGNAWNPLAIPYELYIKNEQNDIDRACEFVNDIANNLSNMQSSKDKDPFWENSAASFFFGLIMLLFEYASRNNLSAEYVNIRNLLKLRSVLCKNYYAGQIPTPAVNYAKSDPFIFSLLIGTLETAQTTQAGILSTFDQKMRTFAIQPSLLDMLASDDNIIKGVQDTPSAVFLIVPDEKTSYHNLVSLFIKQSYEYFIYSYQQGESNKPKNRINYILDEFSSLPTIADFPAMITAARSRNIRFTLFVQSKHQLDLRYREEAETIRSNCNNWIFLVSREVSLLEELSKLCGVRRLTDGAIVPVLSITDLQRLDKDKGETLILSGRNNPIITNLPDIKLYDGGTFSKPTRIEQLRQQYDIDFKFKDEAWGGENDILSESLFDDSSPSTEENTNFLQMSWPPNASS
jgi:type IV secretion system protein VirD4